MTAVLFYYFDASLLLILLMLLWGISAGIVTRLFLGYFVPTGFIFRSRFVLYGIASGVWIGILIELKNIIQNQTFTWPEGLQMMLIALPIGLLGGGWIYLQFRKLKSAVSDKYYVKCIVCDNATYMDNESKVHKGLLLLTEDKLLFYAKVNNKCLLDIYCRELNPDMKRDKILSVPEGFILKAEEKAHVRVAFPFYWLKLMGMDSSKVIQHQYS